MKKEHIILKTGRNELTKIEINNILYLKADGNYTHIKFLDTEKTITICHNLKNTVATIKSDSLVKINRGTVVNNKYIKILKTGKTPVVILSNNEKLKLSRRLQKELKEKFIHPAI